MSGELRIEVPGAPARRVPLADHPLVLGGGPAADIRLEDPALTPRHCRLEMVGGRLEIVDLGSRTGTFARGQRVERLSLEAGEDFVVGAARITFDLGRPAVGPMAFPSALAETMAGPAPARPLALTLERPAPAPEPPAPREVPSLPRIPGYVVERPLRKGAMGTTYLARTEEGEPCVLKTIELRGGSQAVFFIREVQMGTKLRHPHIVRVLDFGESGGLLFLAMEYVAGGSLLDRIQAHGPVSSADAVRQVSTLSGALEYAHHKRFVHRDIKPANILLMPDGVPKLADFGLAKMLSDTRHVAFTQAGDARGTPLYMAPEVVYSPADADVRADIYSLGATYYHALTGRPPFAATSAAKVLTMVVKDEPEPLERHAPDVAPALAEVIRKMMRKRVDDRYASPAELSHDLAGLATELT